MFPGETLNKQSSPTLKGDHKDLDDFKFISEEDKAKYMLMIGTAQWLVTLERFDIDITVSTLSLYRAAPHKGHLKHMMQLYGYVKHFPMLLYIFEQMSLITVKWYMNPTNGYTLFVEILKKNYHQICPSH